MPAGDRTGPAGLGPMTGRGAGYCAGYPVPGYMNSPAGRGYGRGFAGRGAGRGPGRGRRNWYYATGQSGRARAASGLPAFGGAAPYYPQRMSVQEETEMLKEESEYLKQELEDIEKRIKELQKEGESSK